MSSPPIATVVGHSASVEAVLVAHERSYAVAQLGPSRVMLRSPAEIPAGPAEVILTIDGRVRRWNVMMPFGSVPFDLDIVADPVD